MDVGHHARCDPQEPTQPTKASWVTKKDMWLPGFKLGRMGIHNHIVLVTDCNNVPVPDTGLVV
jgi:hypothetical protein